MKKFAFLSIAVLVLVACLTACSNNYEEVRVALQTEPYYFNGGSDILLNEISFSEENATIKQVKFTGNGASDQFTKTFPYSIKKNEIIVSVENDAELKIPYTNIDGKLKLGTGDYYTIGEVKEGLKGYWKDRSSDVILGRKIESEDNFFVADDYITEESANQNYYFEPRKYNYDKLSHYGFNIINFFKGYFFNIIDNKPVFMHFDDPCTPTDGFPGPSGYHF